MKKQGLDGEPPISKKKRAQPDTVSQEVSERKRKKLASANELARAVEQMLLGQGHLVEKYGTCSNAADNSKRERHEHKKHMRELVAEGGTPVVPETPTPTKSKVMFDEDWSAVEPTKKKKKKKKKEIVEDAEETTRPRTKKKVEKQNNDEDEPTQEPSVSQSIDKLVEVKPISEVKKKKKNTTPASTATDPTNDEAGESQSSTQLTKAAKRRQRQATLEQAKAEPSLEQQGYYRQAFNFPFRVQYGDHFETSEEALLDIAPLLRRVAPLLRTTAAKLRIYDPYFCNGAVVRHLNKMGFATVVHRKEDFYAAIAENRVPPHDVIVTNPPYSMEHKEKILQFCASSGKPWFILLPNYICTKQYYAPVQDMAHILRPTTRYLFDHIEGTGRDESPFHSFWFIHLGEHGEVVWPWYAKKHRAAAARVSSSVGKLVEEGHVPGSRVGPARRQAE